MQDAKPTRRIPALLALLLACAGCAGVGRYARDRALDLADCFTLAAGPGLIADVDVHLTEWVATGAGVGLSQKWGFAGRHPVGFGGDDARTGLDVHVTAPLVPLGFWLMPRGTTPGCTECATLRFFCTDFCIRDGEAPAPYNWSPYSQASRSILLLNMCPFHDCPEAGPRPKTIDAFDLSLGATVLPVSVRAGFSPGQFLDFLLGWFGLDIASDDSLPKPLQK